MGLRVHPRTRKVQAAAIAIGLEIESAAEEHDLTAAELTGILAAEISSIAKAALRFERHPGDPGKGADEA